MQIFAVWEKTTNFEIRIRYVFMNNGNFAAMLCIRYFNDSILECVMLVILIISAHFSTISMVVFLCAHQYVCPIIQLLSNLGVESLLLPAVPQLLQTWTSSFGFSKMTSSDRLNFSEHTILYFLDTTMCRKSLIKGQKALVKPKGILTNWIFWSTQFYTTYLGLIRFSFSFVLGVCRRQQRVNGYINQKHWESRFWALQKCFRGSWDGRAYQCIATGWSWSFWPDWLRNWSWAFCS